MSSKSLHIHFPCALHFKSFKLRHNTLYRIVYLNVVVQIVTVSNIIHAGTMNSGSSMSLTFKMMSQVKVISFCREMPKSSWGTDFIYAFTSYSGGSRGGGPRYFYTKLRPKRPKINYLETALPFPYLKVCIRHWVIHNKVYLFLRVVKLHSIYKLYIRK